MTLEQIEEAPKGSHFAFINDSGYNNYVVSIMRKIDFTRGKISRHDIRYESVRAHVGMMGKIGSIKYRKDTTLPITSDSAKKYYSQKPEDFTKVKQMIIKAPFLPTIKSLEFRL